MANNKYGNIRLRTDILHRLKNTPLAIGEIADKNNMSFFTVLNWVDKNQVYLTTELNQALIRKLLKIPANERLTMDIGDKNLKMELE